MRSSLMSVVFSRALMKKGLRRYAPRKPPSWTGLVFSRALMKKGLRPTSQISRCTGSSFFACPDEEGITTDFSNKPLHWDLPLRIEVGERHFGHGRRRRGPCLEAVFACPDEE